MSPDLLQVTCLTLIIITVFANNIREVWELFNISDKESLDVSDLEKGVATVGSFALFMFNNQMSLSEVLIYIPLLFVVLNHQKPLFEVSI